MLTRFLIHIVALLFVFYFIWHVHQSTLGAAIIMAVILALVNAVIRPVLLILTLPVTIVTLGLFVIVLNALLFGLSFAVLQGIMGVHFDLTFFQILIGYVIYVIVSTVLTQLIH